jgi:hypothetical protein
LARGLKIKEYIIYAAWRNATWRNECGPVTPRRPEPSFGICSYGQRSRAHKFTFNEAISFMVHCNSQEEIDYFWSKLSADRKAEQCGWLKDKFGLSWQIVPTVMDEMLRDKDDTRLARVTESFLKMKKFDIAKLKEAYGQGRSAA